MVAAYSKPGIIERPPGDPSPEAADPYLREPATLR